MALGEASALLGGDLSLILEIDLISYQKFDGVRAGVLFDLFEPVGDVVEGLFVSDVVD